MPNYQPQPMPWQGVNQQPVMNQMNGFQQQYQQQPQQTYQAQTPVMSIAPVRGRENALQFPVAVGTDLYLIDMQEMKLYKKNNPANPREMEEFDLNKVVVQENQNEYISRAEFDEMKGMMAQLVGLVQSQQQPQSDRQVASEPHDQRNKRYERKGGNKNA